MPLKTAFDFIHFLTNCTYYSIGCSKYKSINSPEHFATLPLWFFNENPIRYFCYVNRNRFYAFRKRVFSKLWVLNNEKHRKNYTFGLPTIKFWCVIILYIYIHNTIFLSLTHWTFSILRDRAEVFEHPARLIRGDCVCRCTLVIILFRAMNILYK